MVDEDDGKRCEVYVTRCSESNESSIAIVGMLVPDVQCGLFTLAIFIFLLCDLTDVLGGGASFAVFATLLPVRFSPPPAASVKVSKILEERHETRSWK